MAGLKTKPTGASVEGFLGGVEPARRRDDAATLAAIMARATGVAPVMWGPSIVGYGRYDYTYGSGHSGSYFMAGFSPRKSNLVVYVMPGFAPFEPLLARLGKYRLGKSCLYINSIADIDACVLEALIRDAFAAMRDKYAPAVAKPPKGAGRQAKRSRK